MTVQNEKVTKVRKKKGGREKGNHKYNDEEVEVMPGVVKDVLPIGSIQ